MTRTFIAILGLVQVVLAARVILRLARTSRGETIQAAPLDESPRQGAATVLLPVLDEGGRLSPCLDGLIEQNDEVAEILVIDGGSTDGTQDLVETYAAQDPRIRLIDASPIPEGWNGKAWGLHAGLEQSNAENQWVVTIDADVRPRAGLVAALLSHAGAHSLDALSVATSQQIEGFREGLFHPSMLTTLIYRFGIPGNRFRDSGEVQANGQCFLARREQLERAGGFEAVKGSICEDITLARIMVIEGAAVGFYEAPGLVSVDMYDDWRATLREWPRSLPMRDRFWGVSGPLGLLETVLVQALPVPLLVQALLGGTKRLPGWLVHLNVALAITRMGVLAGTSRAYTHRPWSYWLSPLVDLPVALTIVMHAFRRSYTWRGQALVRGG